MKSSDQIQATPSFRLLSAGAIQEIHQASLRILERTGVRVENAEALALLRDAGAKLKKQGLVCLPAELVEQAISSAPESVTLHHRDRTAQMVLQGRRVYYGTGSDCLFVYDLQTGQKRRTVKQDTVDFAVLADCLENIHFVMSMGNCQDVAAELRYMQEFEAMVTHSSKPICFTAQKIGEIERIVRASSLIAGGLDQLQAYPFLILYNEPISPLVHPAESVEKILYCAEHQIPMIYASGVSGGATGPVTLAGSVAQANAEILSGLTIHQLKSKGAPFVYGSTITVLDMSTTNFTHGSPEHFLMSTARAELAQHYNLPIFGVGGRTDSKCTDVQAGIEYALSTFFERACGAGMVHDVGFTSTGLVSSHEMLILADEMIGMIERYMRGIEITAETLAEQVIDRVGPGGEFITDRHTLENFKKELWFPRFANRDSLASWEHKGTPQLIERLRDRARAILRTHQPRSLPAGIAGQIAEILG